MPEAHHESVAEAQSVCSLSLPLLIFSQGRSSGPTWPECTPLCPEGSQVLAPSLPILSSLKRTVWTIGGKLSWSCEDTPPSSGFWEPHFPKVLQPRGGGADQVHIPAPALAGPAECQHHELLDTPNSPSVQGS